MTLHGRGALALRCEQSEERGEVLERNAGRADPWAAGFSRIRTSRRTATTLSRDAFHFPQARLIMDSPIYDVRLQYSWE
jgi:hypothetical protein